MFHVTDFLTQELPAKFFLCGDTPKEPPKGHRRTILSGIKDKYVEDDYVSALKLVYNDTIRVTDPLLLKVGLKAEASPNLKSKI